MFFYFFSYNYIKWGFESRLKPEEYRDDFSSHYIKWGFESRLKRW